LSVRLELLHGEDNERYLQRCDHTLRETGKFASDSKAGKAKVGRPYTIKESMEAPWVWSEEAALAVWS